MSAIKFGIKNARNLISSLALRQRKALHALISLFVVLLTPLNGHTFIGLPSTITLAFKLARWDLSNFLKILAATSMTLEVDGSLSFALNAACRTQVSLVGYTKTKLT